MAVRDDCTLFAIAFATTLCHGNNPTTTRYDQRTMRNHLVDCLEAMDMTEFPTTEKRAPLVLIPVSTKTVQFIAHVYFRVTMLSMSSVMAIAVNGIIQLVLIFHSQ